MHAVGPPGGSSHQSADLCDQRRSVIRGRGERWITQAACLGPGWVSIEEGARSCRSRRRRRSPRRTRLLIVPSGSGQPQRRPVDRGLIHGAGRFRGEDGDRGLRRAGRNGRRCRQLGPATIGGFLVGPVTLRGIGRRSLLRLLQFSRSHRGCGQLATVAAPSSWARCRRSESNGLPIDTPVSAAMRNADSAIES